MNTKLVLATTALTLIVAACGDDDNGVNNPSAAPAVTGFSVAANTNNVLSAIASVTATNTDSARVVYWTSGGAHEHTPYTTSAGDQSAQAAGRIVVLGLRPETDYSLAVEAVNAGGSITSDTVTFTTAALPTFLQSASISSTTPTSGGYILASLYDGSTAYATAFDSAGRVAWYRAFPGGKPVAELKQQTNGNITASISLSHGGELVEGNAVTVSPDGNILRTYSAPTGSFFDVHELWELSDTEGGYAGAVLFAYTQRHLDLSSSGGPADSLVVGHQIVKQDASGNQSVLFDAWDHFTIADNVEPSAGQVDFDHPNALTFASDGNYIVSWRNLDVLTKIDANTGALIWTFASSLAHIPSDFTIESDPLNGFSAQHTVRSLADGNLILFDNGSRHTTPHSRAVEYHLDTGAHTATMVWDFTHAPSLWTMFTGSVQRFQNGSTLIGWVFGNPLLVTEVSSSGATVWEGAIHATGTQVPYRATKILSLYGYQQP